MKCGNCGNEVKNEDKFCNKCGSPLLLKKNMQHKKSSKRTLIILGTILAMLCLSGALFFIKTDGQSGKLIFEKEKPINENSNYWAWVENREGKIGYISKDGEEVIPCKYDYAGDFENGFARVGMENGVDEDGRTVYLYGLINTSGEETLQCKYDRVRVLEGNKLISVGLNKKEWLIDINGNDIVSNKYDYVWWKLGKTGLISVSQDGKYGSINGRGEEIISLIYDDIFFIENKENRDLICVQKGIWSDK